MERTTRRVRSSWNGMEWNGMCVITYQVRKGGAASVGSSGGLHSSALAPLGGGIGGGGGGGGGAGLKVLRHTLHCIAL